jgi:hypothetical protein
MIRTVFYSWQSDSESSANRNLIERALEKALRAIAKDENLTVVPAVDRDTAGLPGTPAIADSIFAKIQRADAFVADVTIVNPSAEERKTPNPNVLIELGFAVSTLGWDRILLVQNTAHGKPEILPFDLRSRRVITYEAQPGETDRTEARALLQGRFESALLAAIKRPTILGRLSGEGIPIWWGKWEIESRGGSFGGALFIWEVGATGFLFHITKYSGTHSGELTGFARIVSPDVAHAEIGHSDQEKPCEIGFRRSTHGFDRKIEVDELGGCRSYHGMGATFSGTFVRQHDSLFNSGFLDELDLQRLFSITGQYFDKLAACFQGVSEHDNLDSFEARVLTGAPRGMFTIAEGIVMRGKFGEIWTAFIDGNQVKYFTTEHGNRLPETIERWRERFKDKEVVFVSDVERIHKDHFASMDVDHALEKLRADLEKSASTDPTQRQ